MLQAVVQKSDYPEAMPVKTALSVDLSSVGLRAVEDELIKTDPQVFEPAPSDNTVVVVGEDDVIPLVTLGKHIAAQRRKAWELKQKALALVEEAKAIEAGICKLRGTLLEAASQHGAKHTEPGPANLRVGPPEESSL